MRSAIALWMLVNLGVMLFVDTPEPPLAPPPLRMGEGKFVAPPVVRASDSFVLTDEVLLVFDTKDECIFTSSPRGIVSITKEPGPLRIKGRFAQSPDRVETRNFTGTWVYTVEPLTKAGEFELLAWVIGETDESKIQRFQVSIGGPRPPPVPPGPTPEPGPKPDGSSPWPNMGLRVLVVYESSTLKPAESNVMNSRIVRDYLDSKCAKGSDAKTPEYRFFDKDTTIQPGFWKEQLDKRRTVPTPRIAIGTGFKGYEGPLPPTVDELMTLLRKYGDK